MDPPPLSVPRDGFLGLSGYHWLVIAAGWAGWGFDVFDAVLFNFVAPDCIPALLHPPRGSHAAHQATVFSISAGCWARSRRCRWPQRWWRPW